ncbi:MAG: nucleotidyltransferase family protein [Dehalococcoidia bacterium]|nr:nucleotidyltransferase family protein [Dehalococcoidia bacterium]
MRAIILAGGKGERLRPFTDDRPKPMVEVLGIPILGYQIQWLKAQGVTHIVISCGYRCEVIQEWFNDGQKWGVCIDYSVEETPLGRGGGIKKAFSMLPAANEPLIATNGDIITNFSLQPVLEEHQRSGALATIVLTPFVSPYGIVEITEDNKVTGFREKPTLPYWINGGIYILSPDVYSYLPDQGDHEDTTFPQLAQQGRLGSFKIQAFWRAVDTVKDLSEVNQELERRLIGSFLSQD